MIMKLHTSGSHEDRWVNLQTVSRVTYVAADESGEPLLTIFFDCDDPDCTLRISGREPVDREAIRTVMAEMEALSNGRIRPLIMKGDRP